MCRWLAYSGNTIHLDRLLFEPEHSLIDQSRAARYSESTTNGDGFGLGWYTERSTPGVFKDLRPAWNDPNLRDLSSHIQSSLFLAHVRATTGTEIQRSNCHPFREGRWLFMHNGAIAEFSRLKRELVLAIDEELFPCIRGTTDTEIMFLLALTFGLDSDPITAVERMVGFVEQAADRQGVADAMQMTVCLSNGDSLYAFRYATCGTPRSLYVNVDLDCLCELDVEPSIFEPHAKVIVSEPFGGLSDDWEEIAPSSLIVVEDGAIHRRPFEPKV